MIKNIFISFKVEDESEILAMRLDSYFPDISFEYFAISDRKAIKSHDDADIRQIISAKMARTDLTVCFISPATHLSPWVRRELEESFEKGNEVIAMALKGVMSVIMPKPLKVRDYPLYPWNPTGLLHLTSQQTHRKALG